MSIIGLIPLLYLFIHTRDLLQLEAIFSKIILLKLVGIYLTKMVLIQLVKGEISFLIILGFGGMLIRIKLSSIRT